MQSDTIGALAAALSAVQGELEDVTRDRSGRGYKYADLGAVLAEIRPALARHGLALIQCPGEMVEGIVTLESTLLHESGEWVRSRCSAPVEQVMSRDGKPVTSLAQAVGSVITYLRRYSAAAIVGLTQVDNDASLHHETRQEAQQRPQQSRQATTAANAPSTVVEPGRALQRETQGAIWATALKLWDKDEAPGRIARTLESLGLPKRSADLTEEQGRQLLDALIEEVGRVL